MIPCNLLSMRLVSFVLLIRSALLTAESDSFDDIISLTKRTIDSQVEQTDTFVMFYAPWCGHCKNLKPTFAELRKTAPAKTELAKVDCTVETELCVEENVRGYPTLIYYSAAKGGTGVRYKGSRSVEKLTEFMKQQFLQSKDSENSASGVPMDDGVYVLTAANFQDFVMKGDTFVKFYAPWCGHCKKLKPVWSLLGKELNQKEPINIAKVDCTEHASVCNEMDVSGYPSLLYLRNGRLQQKYSGTRDFDSLLLFIGEQLSTNDDITDTQMGQVEFNSDDEDIPESLVVELTSETFRPAIASSKLHFVKFYAPWCGHCKKLAPIWEDLAQEYAADDMVTIAKVDCTEETAACESQQISGYPTLKLFYGGKFLATYKEDRGVHSFAQFLNRYRPKEEL